MDPYNGGTRDNAGKMARYDLIAPEFLEALAVHTGWGALKYADRNWERGMHWCKPFTSGMRHAWKWFRGESYDEPDPKMPGYRAHHLIAQAWNCMAAYTYEMRGIGIDDRPATRRRHPETSGIQVAWGDPAVCQGSDQKPDTTVGETPTKVTFWYLATPYTNYAQGHVEAANMACRKAAELMLAGVPVFSPIAHSHPIAVEGLRDKQLDHDFWMRADAPMMEAASGLIVVMCDGYNTSRGVQEEIRRFQTAGKPVVFWIPTNPVPKRLLP